MKNVKRITEGTMIDTPTGYMIATGFNGSLVFFDVFEPEMIEDENGNLAHAPGSGMFDTEEEALSALAEYEAEDRIDGTYTEDFYEVIEEVSL